MSLLLNFLPHLAGVFDGETGMPFYSIIRFPRFYSIVLAPKCWLPNSDSQARTQNQLDLLIAKSEVLKRGGMPGDTWQCKVYYSSRSPMIETFNLKAPLGLQCTHAGECNQSDRMFDYQIENHPPQNFTGHRNAQ